VAFLPIPKADYEPAVASQMGIDTGFLSVVSSAMAAPLWNAHPECPKHVKADLEARVRALEAEKASKRGIR